MLPCDCCCVLLLQPNAEAQFLEVKNAFTVLSDPKQRSDYDRKMRGVSGARLFWLAVSSWKAELKAGMDSPYTVLLGLSYTCPTSWLCNKSEPPDV